MAHGVLQPGYIVREGHQLRNRVGEFIYRHTVARTDNLSYESGGSLRFKRQLFQLAQTGVQHEGQVQRLLRFGLEDFDLLWLAFFIDLELIAREVRGGAIVLIQDTGEDVNQIYINLDLA